jgi:hypothetical protein
MLPIVIGGDRGGLFVVLADSAAAEGAAQTGNDIGARLVALRAYEFRCNERQRHIVRQ